MATRSRNGRPREGGERLHGDAPAARGEAFARVYELVRRIPRGRVMTYGQISVLLGGTLSPRAVGWAMHGCPRGVPWQRVVNASGGCSTDRLPDAPPGRQRDLLEAEGVEFRANGTLDLDVYRFVPRETRVRAAVRPAPRPRSR
jgi:methylated-DNA-protein-cysteine methyltransferase-like protein